MRRILFLFVLSCFSLISSAQQVITPDIIYGKLFHDVQMAGVLKDGKTFPDCIPKRNPADIVHDYLGIVNNPPSGFSLKEFVKKNFELPAEAPAYSTAEKNLPRHIKNLWPVLTRKSDRQIAGSSLLPLPYPYIVPGGRFREIYYWDSYFTMLGLKAGGENALIEDMVKNFAWLIDTYGHIPNGNRTYYLSRSQPPFFALMIDLLASVKGDAAYTTYLPQMEKEYRFWMDGSETLKENDAFRRVVKMNDSSLLNRYWDDSTSPRPESYREDIITARTAAGRNKAEIYRNLRAAAESGFDFSSRWFADKKDMATIQTVHIIPVDLNSLLYKLELNIAKGKMMLGDEKLYNEFFRKAQARRNAINKYCWSESLDFYTDYNFKTSRTTDVVSPAGMYPFCLFESRLDYMSLLARKSAVTVRNILLKEGGIVTTGSHTGQQWDSPNGWAPLQWMTIWGFARCGQIGIAREINNRWMKLNEAVFSRTGKLMEKYNVVNINLEAGGGEYKGQDGFGWTNGVYLALLKGDYF